MKILVPVDGSPPANRAVRHAIELVGRADEGKLLLVNVQSPETLDVSDISAVTSRGPDRELAAQRSHKALRRAVRLCREARVEFECRAELGPVGDTIARLARRLEVDQIVMGSRGLGAVGRLFLGSVASRVIHLTRLPVTLVK